MEIKLKYTSANEYESGKWHFKLENHLDIIWFGIIIEIWVESLKI